MNVNGGGYGQNLLFGVGADPSTIESGMVQEFYTKEQPNYPEYGVPTPDMSNFESWGHFSQLVWKGTTHVGCYTKTDCGFGGEEVQNGNTVCNYGPPGNMGGEYGANVLPASS
ncbi:MAG: hypothetical protein M1838_003859 [Thelocarpon superellum]|nr:MAG: hypothetical protein M1838_003859 [Thelocarpon superellum]